MVVIRLPFCSSRVLISDSSPRNGEFVLGRVVEYGERHVMVGADRRAGIRRLQDRLEPGLQPFAPVAHAQSLRANSIEDSAGQFELGEAPRDFVVHPAELVEAKDGLLDVGRPHQVEPPVGRVDILRAFGSLSAMAWRR